MAVSSYCEEIWPQEMRRWLGLRKQRTTNTKKRELLSLERFPKMSKVVFFDNNSSRRLTATLTEQCIRTMGSLFHRLGQLGEQPVCPALFSQCITPEGGNHNSESCSKFSACGPDTLKQR